MTVVRWFHCANRLPTVFVLLLITAVATTEATCNEEQIEACREAALAGRLDVLRSSGECLAKQYMEFSHLCSVTNYLPTVEYCCCRHLQDNLLCCRYHQDWNRFRCQEADDVIMTRGLGAKGALIDLPPLEILLPSTLIPLVLILFVCFVCLVVCCCCRSRRRRRQKMNESDTIGLVCHRCFSCCYRPESRRTKRNSPRSRTTTDPIDAASTAPSPDDDPGAATTPLNRPSAPDDDQLRPLSVSRLPFDPTGFEPDDRPCHHCGAHRLPLYSLDPPPPPAFVEPSAPPSSEDVILYSGALTSFPVSDHCACADRSRVEPMGVGCVASFCPRCIHLQPPPPYDESLNHRVV